MELPRNLMYIIIVKIKKELKTMLMLLDRFALWVDANYEKIWLVMIAVAAILFIVGLWSGNEEIYGMSEDISDFYDEVFSE